MDQKQKRNVGVAISELAAVLSMSETQRQQLDGLKAARDAIESVEHEITLQIIQDDITRGLTNLD